MIYKDNESKRETMLDQVKRNIRDSGYHLYIVASGVVPRYAYSIGLRDSLGAELIVGGAIYYMAEEIQRIVLTIREQMNAGKPHGVGFQVESLGSFALRSAHRSWISELMLGALDYYDARDVPAFQVVPDAAHWTIDVPDMQKMWSPQEEPVWRWIREPWPYAVSRTSTAMTNLDALRGARITEVTRWSEDEWEMFAGAGPDVASADSRVVPLSSLLAADPSLAPAVDLKIGNGIWRDSCHGDWNPWGSSNEGSQS